MSATAPTIPIVADVARSAEPAEYRPPGPLRSVAVAALPHPARRLTGRSDFGRGWRIGDDVSRSLYEQDGATHRIVETRALKSAEDVTAEREAARILDEMQTIRASTRGMRGEYYEAQRRRDRSVDADER